ncbi:ribosomal maturation YjgA family protein [Enterovibrio norvegicus]|uniref:ribosomal maturation YjgA family protein n=1 Tax=Enterovibrio norvegicus TaxID=188144 RepID=UPI00215960AC|nr:DUF2809 domain-containing protein [Enterovibrio norvegicus]
MITFNGKYFLASMALLAVLIGIALFVKDSFVRPFLGDELVVVWMYAFLAAFLLVLPLMLSLFVLVFAYCVEIGQYFRLVEVVGLQNNKLASIVIGSTFDWLDLLAYTLGWGVIWVFQKQQVREV